MEALEKIIKRYIRLQVVQAIVTEVNNDVCTVKIDKGNQEIFKCSLNAVLSNNSDKMIFYPTVGSSVVIGIYESKREAVILSFSDVEKVYFKKGTTELEADKDGYKVDRDGENLKKVLNDWQAEFGKLCDEVSKIVVNIGTSPNVPVIQQIKQKVDGTIKNRLNKILK